MCLLVAQKRHIFVQHLTQIVWESTVAHKFVNIKTNFEAILLSQTLFDNALCFLSEQLQHVVCQAILHLPAVCSCCLVSQLS